jgi:urea transport system permease protein
MSTLIVVFVAIGGRGTLMGTVVGVLTVNWLSNLLSENYPNLWQILLGTIIVLVVLFFSDGLYGSLLGWWKSRKLSALSEVKTGGSPQGEISPDAGKEL